MIFVTVGTHEQQFDRLIKHVDQYVQDNGINKADIFIQTGYTKYNPSNCTYKSMLTYKEMNYYYELADIIITHGGPGSMFLPWKLGKKVIAVPRKVDFGEHVDNHQVDFCEKMEKEGKVIAVKEISELSSHIDNMFNNKTQTRLYTNNTKEFIKKFNKEVNSLFDGVENG
ncbi:PssE/Cps14G family polysaccharide biosynthesis glycosyltransferase [Pontibacillus salicampi]|uniref:PssE/Cps14G family polysaccharide biosynthesis glycosyltransferase n=1 Tax=Pontibacillus salicampi TaxID=1449801 RepID=A0ABV6LSB8_9BACI